MPSSIWAFQSLETPRVPEFLVHFEAISSRDIFPVQGYTREEINEVNLFSSPCLFF